MVPVFRLTVFFALITSVSADGTLDALVQGALVLFLSLTAKVFPEWVETNRMFDSVHRNPGMFSGNSHASAVESVGK